MVPFFSDPRSNPWVVLGSSVAVGLTIAKSVVELHTGRVRIEGKTGTTDSAFSVVPAEQRAKGPGCSAPTIV